MRNVEVERARASQKASVQEWFAVFAYGHVHCVRRAAQVRGQQSTHVRTVSAQRIRAAVACQKPQVNFVVAQRDRKAGGREIAGGQQAHAGMLGSDPVRVKGFMSRCKAKPFEPRTRILPAGIVPTGTFRLEHGCGVMRQDCADRRRKA